MFLDNSCLSIFCEEVSELLEYSLLDVSIALEVVTILKFFKRFFFLLTQSLWHINIYVYYQIAYGTSVTLNCWQTFSSNSKGCSWLCTRLNTDFNLSTKYLVYLVDSNRKNNIIINNFIDLLK